MARFLLVLIQLGSMCVLTFDGNKPALDVFSKLAYKALLHVELFQESLKKNIDSDFRSTHSLPQLLSRPGKLFVESMAT